MNKNPYIEGGASPAYYDKELDCTFEKCYDSPYDEHLFESDEEYNQSKGLRPGSTVSCAYCGYTKKDMLIKKGKIKK